MFFWYESKKTKNALYKTLFFDALSMSNWRMPLLKQWLSAKMWRRPCYNWCFHIASRCYVKEALYKINFLLIPASFLLAGTAHRACCGRHSQSKTLLLKTTINIYNDIWQPFAQTTVFTKGNEPAKGLGGGSDELPRNSQWARKQPNISMHIPDIIHTYSMHVPYIFHT